MSAPSDSRTDAARIVEGLRGLGSEADRAGMARFGINADRAFGVSMATLRPLAKRLGRDQALSLALWATGYHEARLLAVLIGEPGEVTPAQMDAWAAAFDSWDLTDQACLKLFVKTPHVFPAVERWAADDRQFVRRAAFALMASAAVHLKKTPDNDLLPWLGLIETHAGDDRNFVRKAVNWALRQIGKRSKTLHAPALDLAERLAASDDRTRRWIGRDAARELSDPKQLARLAARAT